MSDADFVDSIWPDIKRVIDSSIFGVDTNKAGVEGALKLAADIALLKWKQRDGQSG